MEILRRYTPGSKPLPENRFTAFLHHKPLVFLLRHGSILGSSGKRYIGSTDVLLSAEGRNQAVYWKRLFDQIQFDSIYSSTLQRCRKTAEIIRKQSNIIYTPQLNEIDLGAWENLTFTQVKKQYPDQFIKRGRCIDRFKTPGGESFEDVSRRAVPLLEKAVEKKETTLIITHAGVIRTLICHVKKMALRRLFEFKLSYGDLFVLHSPDDAGSPGSPGSV